MAKPALGAVLIVLLLGSAAAAEHGKFGAGIILGEPTGLSAKLRRTHDTALDAALAWSFAGKNAVHVHGDFLLPALRLDTQSTELAIYYGLGGRIKLQQNSRMGVRLPFGVECAPKDLPITFFAELVPLLDLVPDTDFGLNAAIGIRYFFARGLRPVERKQADQSVSPYQRFALLDRSVRTRAD